jgi:hypothetical protein
MFLLAIGFMSACSGTHESHRDCAVPGVAAPVREVAGLNVPSLLSLSIDEISRQFGPPARVPASFVDPALKPLLQLNEPLDSTALYRYQGLAIVATYDYNTRQIKDLLVLGSNENELMRRARLKLGAAHYLVLPVFQEKHPTKLLGLRVLSTSLSQ